MSDLSDFTGKNSKFTGTKGLKISTGTTAQRVAEEEKRAPRRVLRCSHLDTDIARVTRGPWA